PKQEQPDQSQPPVVPPKQEEQPKPPAVRPKPESPIIEWKGERKIDLKGNSLSNDYISLTGHMPSVNGGLRVDPTDFAVNLNERSENGLGWNQGRITDDKLAVDDSSKSNQLNYVVVHQPYSYYGVLYDNNRVINSDGKGFSASQRGEFIAGVYAGDPIEKPKGSASYQSHIDDGVIASKEYIDGSLNGVYLTPDGSITLIANFDKNTVSGTLNSSTLGKVELVNTSIYNDREFLGGTKTNGGGTYRGSFSRNYQDVVGSISHVRGKDDKGNFTYSAVFGATKQEPKPKQ
ncbi:hypothetical protein, partial [Rodentibacter myodis]